MSAQNSGASRSMGSLARWGVALAVLLIFAGMLLYRYAPSWLPKAFVLARRGMHPRSEITTSAHFKIYNRSDAQPEQIENLRAYLEERFLTLTAFMHREPSSPIEVDVQNGSMPALPADDRLELSYSGYIDVEMASIALGALIAEKTEPLFNALGVALYAAEGTENLPPSIHQGSDAWVTWLDERELVLPLSEAMEAEMTWKPRDLFRAAVEAASFTRWLVEGWGWEAYWRWFDGADFEETFGIPLDKAERKWLSAVRAKHLEPLPCGAALSGSLSTLCRGWE